MKISIEKKYIEKYKLVTWASDPRLRTRCKPVLSVTHEIQTFANVLFYRMHEHNGVWIAAPQVWRCIRMAAFATLDTSKKDPSDREIIHEDIMINPVVLATSKELMSDEEGCLSLPWELWNVQRPSRATIQWTDLKNRKQLRKVEGYNARIMLHEIDHLDWILFIDKV